MRVVPILFAIALAAGAWQHFSSRPVAHGAGVIAPQTPVQTDRDDLAAFSVQGYRVQPVAEFAVEARVLSTETCPAGREADLSPLDLALGWGRCRTARC
jgi:hypothetical protein